MRALIVEDEAMARASLARLIANNYDDIEIVGQLDSISATLEYLADNRDPDIIFMDVELSDGDCFEIFRQRQLSSHVIMTTAYESYAVKAFEAGSVDYLLKPINPVDLERAIRRCRERSGFSPMDFETILKLMNSASEKKYRERLIVKLGDKYIPVQVSDVAYFLSEDKSNYLVKSDASRYIIDISMDTLEEELDPEGFFRIGRGCVVSRASVESVSRHFNGRLKLNVLPRCSEELFVSRARVDDFLTWLE